MGGFTGRVAQAASSSVATIDAAEIDRTMREAGMGSFSSTLACSIFR
jgi:hypothetical protein